MVSRLPLPGVSLQEEVIEVNRLLTPPSAEAVRAENMIAMALSIVAPGLGQIYKGHVAGGLIWLFLGMPVAVWIGILLSLATAGAGLVVPLLCWAALVIDAYWKKDRRIHHWFMGNGVEEDYSTSID
jgi:TM2 domain-containing membrane protein YozV